MERAAVARDLRQRLVDAFGRDARVEPLQRVPERRRENDLRLDSLPRSPTAPNFS